MAAIGPKLRISPADCKHLQPPLRARAEYARRGRGCLVSVEGRQLRRFSSVGWMIRTKGDISSFICRVFFFLLFFLLPRGQSTREACVFTPRFAHIPSWQTTTISISLLIGLVSISFFPSFPRNVRLHSTGCTKGRFGRLGDTAGNGGRSPLCALLMTNLMTRVFVPLRRERWGEGKRF